MIFEAVCWYGAVWKGDGKKTNVRCDGTGPDGLCLWWGVTKCTEMG